MSRWYRCIVGERLLLLAVVAGLLGPSLGASDGVDFALDESEARLPYRFNKFRESKEQLSDYFRAHGHGLQPRTQVQAERGIVISAGGRRLLSNAFVVVKVIRASSNLPIEIFYDGEEEADQTILEALKRIPDVYMRDASQLPRPDHLGPWPAKLHGYAKKVFSIYSTGFRKVLAIDSDNQPLVNPESLFELQRFTEHGAVFWPDYWKANSAREAPQENIYELLGLKLPWAGNPHWAAVESGQILFDKELHADALDWIMWLNIWSDVVYEFVFGDKDTFEMGFMLARKHDSFYRVPTPPRTALTTKTEEHGDLYHVGMVQSVEGRPSFLHRTSNGKFNPSKSVNEHFRPAYFTEPMSVAAAKQFVWDGSLGINTLPSFAVSLVPPPCKDLDPVTIKVLRPILAARALVRSVRRMARRYSKCKVHRTDPESDQIAMLPIQLYGDDTARAISHSYIAFQELRQILRQEERSEGAQRMSRAGLT